MRRSSRASTETLKSQNITTSEKTAAMPIITRNATIEDLDTLYSIERECFTLEAFSKELVVSLLRNPNSTSLLAEVGDDVVGFVIALTYERGNHKVGHILTIDVALKARKKGVGLRLLEELEHRLREKRAEACCLEVDVENLAARRLYKRMGYAETGFIEGYYSSGGDCVTMKKDLQ